MDYKSGEKRCMDCRELYTPSEEYDEGICSVCVSRPRNQREIEQLRAALIDCVERMERARNVLTGADANAGSPDHQWKLLDTKEARAALTPKEQGNRK